MLRATWEYLFGFETESTTKKKLRQNYAQSCFALTWLVVQYTACEHSRLADAGLHLPPKARLMRLAAWQAFQTPKSWLYW